MKKEQFNSANFFNNTLAEFIPVKISDNLIKPDFISKSGSKYWYTNDGVIRKSDHWGKVKSCTWIMNDIETESDTGFCYWADFIEKDPTWEEGIHDSLRILENHHLFHELNQRHNWKYKTIANDISLYFLGFYRKNINTKIKEAIEGFELTGLDKRYIIEYSFLRSLPMQFGWIEQN